MMRLSRYGGNPNIGVYAAVNESLGFVACDASPEFIKDLETALQIKTIMTTVAGSFVVGSLVVMNSNGAIVSDLSETKELSLVKKEIPVGMVKDKMNAAGNNILANDNGAVISPDMGKRAEKTIRDILDVDVIRSTVAGCNTVGSVCVATNKGCICHPDTTDEELEVISDILKVEAKRASVNHGVKYLGAGILANSKGALIGDDTTPIEMGKIEDGLNLF
ncbi:MAG: translation initiation factor IF-6 [Candidatus Methanomethylophilaceae archaeon]